MNVLKEVIAGAVSGGSQLASESAGSNKSEGNSGLIIATQIIRKKNGKQVATALLGELAEKVLLKKKRSAQEAKAAKLRSQAESVNSQERPPKINRLTKPHVTKETNEQGS